MKCFFDPCKQHRQDIALVACGVLPETDIVQHLAACTKCRAYYEEIKTVTRPLSETARNLPNLAPSLAAQSRWTREIHAASRPKHLHPTSPLVAAYGWWEDVIWRSRRTWAGLAAVWVLILAGHLSLGEPTSNRAVKFSPPSQAMIMAWKDRENVLAELLADHSAPREADRPKFFLPKPRTQNLRIFTT